METQSAERFEIWGILEVLGRLKLAGRISEQTIAGAGFIRIDVPGEGESYHTRWFSTASIYSIAPTDEATARAVARRYNPAPVQPYELPAPVSQRQMALEIDEDEFMRP